MDRPAVSMLRELEVQRLGLASVTITLDTYSHVIPGLQEDAAEKFSQIVADGR